MYIDWTDADTVANILMAKLLEAGDAMPDRGWTGTGLGFATTPRNTFPGLNRFAKYNILVLGKAGVGKSSLINYLLGEDVRTVGSGRSITPLGFHRQDAVIRGVPVTVMDSGGLDIAGLDKWKQLLDREMAQRGFDRAPEKWFHTVLYCLSAGGERVDAFETDLIRELVAQKQRVLIVFTKADQVSKDKIDKLHDIISVDVGEQLAAATVCSLEWEMANGLKVERFGRDKLLQQVIANFWDSIRIRLPLRCVHLFCETVEKWGAEQKSWIDANIGYLNRSVGQEHINGEVERFVERLSRDELPRIVREQVVHTLNLFGAISRMFSLNLIADAADIQIQFDKVKNIGSDDLVPFLAGC